MSAFQMVGLQPALFTHLFDLTDAQLQEVGAQRRLATSNVGFPCRVSLVDAQIGEELLLLHYEHHAVDSPYRAAGPIYVRRGAAAAQLMADELPEYATRRLLSVRAYDAQHLMAEAAVVDGVDAAAEIQRCLQRADVQYLHLHNARTGCFLAEVVRV